MPAKKRKRDIEKGYSVKRFAAKLRRLAECLEKGKKFSISIAGERVVIPSHALISVEHERGKTGEEVEFQMKWKKG